MRLLQNKIILLLLICFVSIQSKATHLVGGSMDYEYMGIAGNNIRYKVTLTIYRDCSNPAGAAFDATIQIGAYNNDVDKSLHQIFLFSLINSKNVNPPQGANCPTAFSVCLQEGLYSQEILLPKSTLGYHLIFSRCCRNNGQVNIFDKSGQTYYAFIPNTNTVNSSPKFSGVPAPYICVNDSSTYLNNATDPDGDSLSYALVTPWAGGSDVDAIPTPGANLKLPIDTVPYLPGFNGRIPFGSSGFASIENITGLTTMYAPLQGLYSMAIEVTEWRNGVKLSTIRRDVQIIAINCAGNSKPNIFPLTGTVNKTVEAGEKICFDIRATDFDQNTLTNGSKVAQIITMDAAGDLFGGGAWQGPAATFAKKTATATVTSEFCWTPSCDQGSSVPYAFVVNAIDDGCPPKSRSISFSITVNKFPGQIVFSGPNEVCEFDTGVIYSTPDISGFKYKWEVKGGVIVGSDANFKVKINWDTAGTGSVLLTQTNNFGCVSPTYEYVVEKGAHPTALRLFNDTVCEFSTNNFYQVTPTVGSKYNWIITGGNLQNNPQPHQANINWGIKGKGLIALIETTKYGCVGDTNFKPIAITRPQADSIYGSQSVCPNITGLKYIAYNGAAGSTYNWVITGGTIVSGNGTDTITVNWGGIGTGTIKTIETTKWGCIGDTITINIIKNHVLQGFKPVGRDSLCEFTNGIPYEVVKTNGSEYFWSATGGKLVKDDSTYTATVDWENFGNAAISVYEISYDSLNNIPCVGAPVTLNIVLHPIPIANIIMGKYKVCEGDTGLNYTLNGFTGSKYTWQLNNDSNNLVGQGTNTLRLNINSKGKYNISTIETSRYGCVGKRVDTSLIITPKPNTTPIVGSTIVCYPNFSPVKYTTSGLDSSTYQWFINSGTIDSGNGKTAIYTTFSGQNNNTIKVVETSKEGCLGDTVNLAVFADNPKIDLNYISVGLPDNYIQANWALRDAPLYDNNFYIERRNTNAPTTAFWKKVGTVANDINTFNDTNIYTDDEPYQYRIKGINLCKKEFYSDTHTNIVVKIIEPERFETQIDWTKYKGWKNGVSNYEVHRKNDKELEYFFSKDIGSDTTDRYDDGLNNFVQRYRIKAWENTSKPDTSWSNEVEIKFTPVLWVPNAFTPNNDGFNNQFIVVPGAIKTFEIEIFNRWGQLVFESKNTAKSWDGKYKDQPCPEGVYIYRIRYTGGDNLIKVLSGNITLIR